MSSQNEPLNILDEIFNDASPVEDVKPITSVTTQLRKPKPKPATKKTTSGSRMQSPTPQTIAAPPKWEYMEVIFREFRGWRPRLVNGRERGDWKIAPVINDYLAALGAEGWELVNITDEHHNEKTAYFKRPL